MCSRTSVSPCPAGSASASARKATSRRSGCPWSPARRSSAPLVVATAADRVFTKDDLRLLSLFAAHAAVAIRNADLFRESERRRGVAERLAEVSRVVSQSLDPAVVARRIADSVFTLFDAKVSTLFRLEPSSTDLVALAVSGDVGEEFGPTMVFPHGTGVTGLAVRERRAVVTPDLLSDPRVTLTPEIRAAIQRAPYRAVLAVPLLAKDSVVGALGIGDRAGRAFDDGEVQLAQAFAAQAAVALENSRLHEELHRALQTVEASQQRLVETERLRASRDLATGVAHHLNNILMVALGRLQLLLPKVDAREIRRDLEAVEQAARNGADVIRRLMEFTEARLVVPTVPVDLNQLAQNALEMTRSQWRDEARARGFRSRSCSSRATSRPWQGNRPSCGKSSGICCSTRSRRSRAAGASRSGPGRPMTACFALSPTPARPCPRRQGAGRWNPSSRPRKPCTSGSA